MEEESLAIVQAIMEHSGDSDRVKHLLQRLTLSVVPSEILSKQLLELCEMVEEVQVIIPFLSALLRWPEDESDLIHLYQDLLQTDRTLIVPILSSLASLPLSESSQSFLYEVSVEGGKQVHQPCSFRFSRHCNRA